MKKLENKPRKQTQYDQIYFYIKSHGSITPMKAFRDLGITKLATRISEMTRSGKYSVTKIPIHNPETGARFMEYSNIKKKRRPKNESK